MTKEQFNSYAECAKSFSVEERGPKECGGRGKEEGGISGGLDSSSKNRAPLPFFNLQEGPLTWTQRTKEA